MKILSTILLVLCLSHFYFDKINCDTYNTCSDYIPFCIELSDHFHHSDFHDDNIFNEVNSFLPNYIPSASKVLYCIRFYNSIYLSDAGQPPEQYFF